MNYAAGIRFVVNLGGSLMRMYGASDWGVFRKSKMGTGAIVMVGIGTEDPAKERFSLRSQIRLAHPGMAC